MSDAEACAFEPGTEVEAINARSEAKYPMKGPFLCHHYCRTFGDDSCMEHLVRPPGRDTKTRMCRLGSPSGHP